VALQADHGIAGIIAALLIDENAGIEDNSDEGLETRGWDPVCHAVAFGPCILLLTRL
jgi:hypothetical protein